VLEAPTEAGVAVLGLLADELSIGEIGKRLFLSPNTIRSRRRALDHMLGSTPERMRSDGSPRSALLEKAESPG
jgi:DNA-binding NarL/FixJ family response regulator